MVSPAGCKRGFAIKIAPALIATKAAIASV